MPSEPGYYWVLLAASPGEWWVLEYVGEEADEFRFWNRLQQTYSSVDKRAVLQWGSRLRAPRVPDAPR